MLMATAEGRSGPIGVMLKTPCESDHWLQRYLRLKGASWDIRAGSVSEFKDTKGLVI